MFGLRTTRQFPTRAAAYRHLGGADYKPFLETLSGKSLVAIVRTRLEIANTTATELVARREVLVTRGRQEIVSIIQFRSMLRITLIFIVLMLFPALAFESIVTKLHSLENVRLYAAVAWLAICGVAIAYSFGCAAKRRRLHKKFRRTTKAIFLLNLTEVINRDISLRLSALTDLGRMAGLFPQKSPNLVEMDETKIIPTAQYQAVQALISDHSTITVGLTGRRGVGKSSLMRLLYQDASKDGAAIHLSIPSLDTANSISKRLVLDLSSRLARLNPVSNERRRLNRRLLLALGMSALLTISTFAAMAFYWDRPAIGFSQWLDSQLRQRPEYFLLLLLTACASSIVCLTYYLGGLLHLAFSRIEQTTDRARKILERYQFDAEESNERTLGLDKPVQLSRKSVLARRMRPPTHSDMVDDFHSLCRLYTSNGAKRRVVILIDELDRVSDRDDFDVILNQIKDFFRTPGARFILSISDEAEARLDRRVSVENGVLESSLDLSVRLQMMSAQESVQLLAERSPGFPPGVSLFCHVLGAGRPRETIRVAREFVDCYTSSASLSHVGRHVVSQIAERELQAVIRESETDALVREVASLVDGMSSDQRLPARLQGLRESDPVNRLFTALALINDTIVPLLDCGFGWQLSAHEFYRRGLNSLTSCVAAVKDRQPLWELALNAAQDARKSLLDNCCRIEPAGAASRRKPNGQNTVS